MKFKNDDEISEILKALSPTRMKILRYCNLWRDIQEISLKFGVTRSGAMYHVDKLVYARLLDVRADPVAKTFKKVYKSTCKEVCFDVTRESQDYPQEARDQS